MEENKLRQELKESESKINIKHSNNISQTQQEILQDLNLLKNEEHTDDRAKSSDKPKHMDKNNQIHKIDEEDHTYEKTSSVLKSRTATNINNNNTKIPKCNIITLITFHN